MRAGARRHSAPRQEADRKMTLEKSPPGAISRPPVKDGQRAVTQFPAQIDQITEKVMDLPIDDDGIGWRFVAVAAALLVAAPAVK